MIPIATRAFLRDHRCRHRSRIHGSRAAIIAPAILFAATVGSLALGSGGCGDPKPREARLVKVVTVTPDDPDDTTFAIQNDTTVLWLGAHRALARGPDGDFLYDRDESILYSIDHAERSVLALPLSDVGHVAELLEQQLAVAPEEERRQIEAVLQLMDITADVERTEITAEIDGYECRKYMVVMTIGQVESRSEYWVTRDIDVDRKLFRTLTHAVMLEIPGAADALAELDRIDGLPVLTTGSIVLQGRVSRTSSHLVAVEYGPVPAELLELPEGYEILPFTLFPGM